MDKQDRMVILLGGVIIIIALIGIVYHEQNYVSSEVVEDVQYKVTWNDYSSEISDAGTVLKNENWQNSYPIILDDENGYIYKVDVKISWEDNRDFSGFLLSWNWTDMISADVNIPELSFSQSRSSYNTIEMEVVENRPKDFIVETSDQETLNNIIQEQGVISSITCNVDLSILTKPILLDNGNDFTIKINYHYCEPEIVSM